MIYNVVVKGKGFDAFCKAYQDGKIKDGETTSVYYLGIFIKDRLPIFPGKDGSPGLMYSIPRIEDSLSPVANIRDFIGNRRWKVKAKN